MKTIGLIGGVSPESTTLYYRLMNEMVREKMGGLHSAKILLYSCDFGEMVELAQTGNWERPTQILADAAKSLERAGAACVLIGANTLHKVADKVRAAVTIPLLHICDATGTAITARGFRRVGLLGTRYTMEDGFYQRYLAEKFGIQIIIPNDKGRTFVHDTIYHDLCHNNVTDNTRAGFNDVIDSLRAEGAEGIILGCTEIPLVVHQADYDIPLFDTTALHTAAAVEFALQ